MTDREDEEALLFGGMLAGMRAILGLGPEPQAVGKDMIAGLGVSTVLTFDLGYETAIVTPDGAHPVERYDSEAAARDGHQRWVKLAPELREVEQLGFGSLVAARRVTLRRFT